jgi:hypothetical protein
MTTYKLFRIREGRLFPLYVEHTREMEIGVWLDARIGELADATHVKSRGGSPLSLRPGFHSTKVPFTDWIGKKGPDGRLYQRKDTVWCECEVEGDVETVVGRNGLRRLPRDWYYFKTNSRQQYAWIISNRILIRRILSRSEVEAICKAHGLNAQPMEGDHNGKQ